MTRYVPREHLWTEWDGDLRFDYNHAIFWPALNRICSDRRAERRRRWEAGGRHIGEHEDYLWGREPVGVDPLPLQSLTRATEEIKTEDVKMEEVHTENSKAEDANIEDSYAEVSKTDNVKTDDVKTDAVKTDDIK